MVNVVQICEQDCPVLSIAGVDLSTGSIDCDDWHRRRAGLAVFGYAARDTNYE